MLGEAWPDPLVRDIARRRAVFVIGSGVSRHALGADGVTRPPVWKGFLSDAAQRFPRAPDTEHIYKAIEDGDLLHACEWLKNRYDEDWPAYLRSRFTDPRYAPGRLHELIALLDTRVVFSLNFDDIYENKGREINEASQFTKTIMIRMFVSFFATMLGILSKYMATLPLLPILYLPKRITRGPALSTACSIRPLTPL